MGGTLTKGDFFLKNDFIYNRTWYLRWEESIEKAVDLRRDPFFDDTKKGRCFEKGKKVLPFLISLYKGVPHLLFRAMGSS